MWFFPGFRVLFSVARRVWFFAVCAGVCELFFAFADIRALLAWFRRGRSVFLAFAFRWHPRIVSVLQASPLCGAAPTFLC
ncbi:hypothetical protein L8949_29110, partial [Paraburkholderia caribensis]|nr:hypothetical protein [Paraburkholderia caribensis]